MNPTLNYFFFLGGEGWGGARVSEFFLTRNPNLKKNSFEGMRGDEVGGGLDRRTDKQAQTNCSLQLLLSRGHNNA